jgi:hypothetical protein
MYELREEPDDNWVKDHTGLEDIDLMDLGTAVEGDADAWNDTMEFMRTNDLSNPANWAQVEAAIDVDELATWLALEIFADNTDWPGNNVRWWRSREPGGKWRWFLYDTDYGLGAYQASWENDTLAFALADDGPDWPNPPWSTELFRLLFTSPAFVQTFVAHYADMLNVQFAPTRTVGLLDSMSDALAPDMDRQVETWGTWTDGITVHSMPDGEWESAVEYIDEWLEQRPTFARQHVVDDLGLAGTFDLRLTADPPGSGTFQLTEATVDGNWTGTYFQGVPVVVTAVPAQGHTFAGWADPSLPQTATVQINSTGQNVALVANFQ